MSPHDFRLMLDEVHQRLVDLTATKGQEYKGGEDTGQFANFERHAVSLKLTREQILWVYFMKHIDSISTFINDAAIGKSRDYAEPIEGRIVDAILYLHLLLGMVRGRTDAAMEGTLRGAGTPIAPGVPDGAEDGHGSDTAGATAALAEFVCARCAREDGNGIATTNQFARIDASTAGDRNPRIVAGEVIAIEALQAAVVEWANSAFGDRKPQAAWMKLFEELGEVIKDPSDHLEWADVFIMLLDLASMHGVPVSSAILSKLWVNEQRAWTERNGVFTHVKED